MTYYKNQQIDILLYLAVSLCIAHKLNEEEREINAFISCYMYLIEKNSKYQFYCSDNKDFVLNTFKLSEQEITDKFMEVEQILLCNIGYNLNIVTPYIYLDRLKSCWM